MKITQKLLLGTFFATTAIAACRKVNNSRSTEPAPYYGGTGGGPTSYPSTGKSLNELFKDLKTASETQCVTVGVTQTLAFTKGTRLTFYPNSFKDASGNVITNGTVCIQMTEMYTPGDMIANLAMTTTADGHILESGGQVNIVATKDGEKVYANKYKIAFKQAGATTRTMALYYGNKNSDGNLTSWRIGDISAEGTTTSGAIFDSTNPPIQNPPLPPAPPSPFSYYEIFNSCTDFGFVNDDQLYMLSPSQPKTMVNVHLPDDRFNRQNTVVFFIVRKINSTVNGTPITGDIFQPIGELPIGEKIDIVAMSKIGDSYYYFVSTGLTITDKMAIKADLEMQSLEFIKTKLSSL